jgi:hypothetical protein
LSFSLLFLRYTTNLRGTLALVPISTHPTIHGFYLKHGLDRKQFKMFIFLLLLRLATKNKTFKRHLNS